MAQGCPRHSPAWAGQLAQVSAADWLSARRHWQQLGWQHLRWSHCQQAALLCLCLEVGHNWEHPQPPAALDSTPEAPQAELQGAACRCLGLAPCLLALSAALPATACSMGLGALLEHPSGLQIAAELGPAGEAGMGPPGSPSQAQGDFSGQRGGLRGTWPAWPCALPLPPLPC